MAEFVHASTDSLVAALSTVDAHGWVHARCVGCEVDTGVAADEPVVLASVVKVLLVLEFARQVAASQLNPTDRVRVGHADRLGGAGVSACADDVELSLRDLALFTMSLSDNTAADLLFERVGLANVRSLAAELGLARTRIFGAPRDVLRSMVEDVGAGDAARFAQVFPELELEQVLATRALDPTRTSASTAREMTRLLTLIWRDEAGPAVACGQVRSLMEQQLNWYRIAAAFDPSVRVAGKTGTFPFVRNEIAVVSYPDGQRYAVAVFTRVRSHEQRLPAVDRAIGAVARTAVERLRDHRCP